MAMTMPPAVKPGKLGFEEPQEALHRIRITLSSKSIKNLEKGKGIDIYIISRHFYIVVKYSEMPLVN